MEYKTSEYMIVDKKLNPYVNTILRLLEYFWMMHNEVRFNCQILEGGLVVIHDMVDVEYDVEEFMHRYNNIVYGDYIKSLYFQSIIPNYPSFDHEDDLTHNLSPVQPHPFVKDITFRPDLCNATYKPIEKVNIGADRINISFDSNRYQVKLYREGEVEFYMNTFVSGLNQYTMGKFVEGMLVKHSVNDEPSVIENGVLFWYYEGKIHRDKDKPAILFPDGSAFYYTRGLLKSVRYANGLKLRFTKKHNYHRTEHCLELPDGTIAWKNCRGELHRERDSQGNPRPAVVYKDGRMRYFSDGSEFTKVDLKDYSVEEATVDETEKCCICTESKCTYSTICKHYFHKECIVRALEEKQTCPLCRGDLKKTIL